jgi:hypothetical protein
VQNSSIYLPVGSEGDDIDAIIALMSEVGLP